jgi:hypothetical protein
MISLTDGSAVKCGICKRDTTIKFTTERIGGIGYDLGCQHRNAYCATCDIMVPDRSDDFHEVVARCPNCNPEEDDDDE